MAITVETRETPTAYTHRVVCSSCGYKSAYQSQWRIPEWVARHEADPECAERSADLGPYSRSEVRHCRRCGVRVDGLAHPHRCPGS